MAETDDLKAAIARFRKRIEFFREHPDQQALDERILCDACEQAEACAAQLRVALEERKTFVLNVAEGCHDYGGGHHSDDHMEAYQHGISTVVNALRVALATETLDSQTAALERIGREQNAAALAKEP